MKHPASQKLYALLLSRNKGPHHLMETWCLADSSLSSERVFTDLFIFYAALFKLPLAAATLQERIFWWGSVRKSQKGIVRFHDTRVDDRRSGWEAHRVWHSFLCKLGIKVWDVILGFLQDNIREMIILLIFFSFSQKLAIIDIYLCFRKIYLLLT